MSAGTAIEEGDAMADEGLAALIGQVRFSAKTWIGLEGAVNGQAKMYRPHARWAEKRMCFPSLVDAVDAGRRSDRISCGNDGWEAHEEAVRNGLYGR